LSAVVYSTSYLTDAAHATVNGRSWCITCGLEVAIGATAAQLKMLVNGDFVFKSFGIRVFSKFTAKVKVQYQSTSA